MNTLTQSLIPTTSFPQSIKVRNFSRRQAGNAAEIAQAMEEPFLGLAVNLSASGEVGFLAVATSKEVFLIAAEVNNSLLLLRDKPFKDLLSGEKGSTLVGFEMALLAIHIGRDLKTAVCGIDLSTLCSSNTREPWRPGEFVSKKVSSSANAFGIDKLWGGSFEKDNRDVCLRAWISACAAECVTTELHNTLKVDTRFLDPEEFRCLGELLVQADLLEAAKPKDIPNEFSNHKMTKDGTLAITNARYRTRIRQGNQTTVIMTGADGREYTGQARSSAGKTAGIKFTGSGLSGTLASVRVVGRQDLTNFEKARDEMLLLFLRRQKLVRDSFFIRMLWFPSRRQQLNAQNENSAVPPTVSISMNDSQLEAVQAMLSESSLVLVHGPPGTGKTTTISAAASIWDKARQNAWIVAHSNVAVKNIAEKLFKNGVDFKLIVSKEFHFEWHEHLYTLIQDNLIRTDELLKKSVDTKEVLGGSCIVLCTLSILLNPGLMTNGLFELVPVERLVIDEASQIKIFDFMPVFAQFSKLKKVCFFGDPNQLPPYGQESAPNVQTIFDLEHLRGLGKFLNVQYRMPVPIGDFISSNVYNGRLQSEHAVTHTSCVSFINVAESREVKGGFSWKNLEEIRTIVHLVRNYYRHMDFCVITPYDAQRAAIENALKDDNLPWESVFNVDSFQGNEAKYVLISVVRSEGPGFLTSLNRMNVMLTRCQAGLVIVTSRSFLHGGGSDTLLGKLARHWEGFRGDDAWVEWRSVANEQVDLPGAPGRKKETSNFGYINRPSATVPYGHDEYAGVATTLTMYGSSRHLSVISQNWPATHPFGTRRGNTTIDMPPQPYQNYDEVYPSLQTANPPTPIPTPLSATTNPHSFLYSKSKPPTASQPQEIRPQPTPLRHLTPAGFSEHAPVEPKTPENQWQPMANNRRERKYSLTRSSYKL